MRRVRELAAAAALLTLAAGCGGPGSGGPDPAEVEAATDSLERLRRLGWYDRGARLGARWLDRETGDAELRARAVEHLARDGQMTRAAEASDRFVEERPSSAWAWYARAAALCRHPDRREEALEASERALELAPGRMPFVRLRAHVLTETGRYREAVAFVDSLPDRLGERPELLTRRALALSRRSYGSGDSAVRARALGTFDRVLEEEPGHLRALHGKGYHLAFFANRIPDGAPLLARAADRTPAPSFHAAYWRALLRHPDLGPEERRRRIEEEVEALLADAGARPALWSEVAAVYDRLEMPDERDRFEERILEEHPRSDEAETVRLRRFRRLHREIRRQREETDVADPETRAAYRSALDGFIERDRHHREAYLGEAYQMLFELLERQGEADPDSLLMAVRGMLEHQTLNPDVVYGDAAVALAERGLAPELARRLPHRGLGEISEQAERRRDIYDSEEEYREALHYLWSRIYEDLGQVWRHQGRLEGAGRLLRQAVAYHGENRAALHHLGQLYEARADSALARGRPEAAVDSLLEEAEGAYRRGVLVQRHGENPNEGALRGLYARRHGGEAGWEAYRASLAEESRRKRRREVLSARLEDPRPVEPFALENLAGREIPFSEFEGKVVVVDFWGTWCGPCVVEMDEVQELWDKYREDPEVAIVTIDEGETADHVRTWMEENGYDFPVLVDDGYIADVGVTGFPTTWFVSPEGRIVFRRRGTSPDLVRSFSWRIEALKEGLDARDGGGGGAETGR